MDNDQIKGIIESVLFVADSPVGVDRLVELIGEGITAEEVTGLLNEIAEEYEGRTLAVVEVAEGWRLQTRSTYAEAITKFFKMERGQRLGRAGLEALAIIAYRQPITRSEIDEIRGVDSGAALRGLVDKSLVKAMGRRKAPGRPMMYGTTKRFLEYFGLSKLSDLPTMDEFADELAAALPPEPPQERLDFDYDEEAEAPDEDINEPEGEGDDAEGAESDENEESAGDEAIGDEEDDADEPIGDSVDDDQSQESAGDEPVGDEPQEDEGADDLATEEETSDDEPVANEEGAGLPAENQNPA